MSFSLNNYLLNPNALTEAHWIEVPDHPGFWVKIFGSNNDDYRKFIQKFSRQHKNRIDRDQVTSAEWSSVAAHGYAEILIEDWWHEEGIEPFAADTAADLLRQPEAEPLFTAIIKAADAVQMMADAALEESLKNFEKRRMRASGEASPT